MKKLLGLTLIFLSVLSCAVYAQEGAANTLCPVSGEEVSGEHFLTHEGKQYGFCCSRCMNKFKASPEKYLANFLKEGESETAGHAGHVHD